MYCRGLFESPHLGLNLVEPFAAWLIVGLNGRKCDPFSSALVIQLLQIYGKRKQPSNKRVSF